MRKSPEVSAAKAAIEVAEGEIVTYHIGGARHGLRQPTIDEHERRLRADRRLVEILKRS